MGKLERELRKRKRLSALDERLEAQGLIYQKYGRHTGKYSRRYLESAKQWLRLAKTPPKTFDDEDIYGQVLPRSCGTFRHQCAIIWTTKLVPTIEAPGEPYAENFKASFAARICDGEQGALLRVWFNGIIVSDRTTVSGDGYAWAPNFSNKIVFYNGSESQTASPVIVAEEGTGNVPGYRGTSYIVCKDIPLGRFSNQLPTIECEVSGASSPDYTTYDVIGFTEPATANITNFAVSRLSSFAYQYDAGVLRMVFKVNAQLLAEVDVQAALDEIVAGCSVVGRICLDEKGAGLAEPVWFGCEDSGGAAFLLRYDGSWASSYSAKVSGASFDSLFVFANKVFVSDGNAGKVYCYDKASLALQWSRAVPISGVEAGTFTVDNAGRVWTVWYDSGDPDTLHLTSVSPGGTVKHYQNTDFSLMGARAVAYDFNGNSLVTGGVTSRALCKMILTAAGIPESDTATASRTCDTSVALFISQYRFSKTFYTTQGTSLYKYRVSDMGALETIALSNFADTGTGNEAYAYDYLTRAIWICRDAAPGMSKLPLNREQEAGTELDDVLSGLCLASGLSAGDIDVTEGAGTAVTGFVVEQQSTAEEPLTQLLTAYQFGVREHFESGYAQIKLEFIDREAFLAAVSVALDEEELGIGDGAPEIPTFAEEKVDEESLPRRVTVRYADVRRAYSSHAQKDEIAEDITTATEEITIELPNLVLTDDQAKQLAVKLLSSAWTEGERKSFTLPLEYLSIEPEDVVYLTLDSVEHAIRFGEVELGANFILAVSAVRVSTEILTSASTGNASPLNTDAVEMKTPSAIILVDCPAVRDMDGDLDDAGLYLFVSPKGTDTDWPGARVYRSDNNTTFAPIATVVDGATWGTTVDALPDGDHYVFDSSSAVLVRLINGSLSTATAAALAEDPLLNLCAIGTEDGGWELLQFATVTDNLDGTYTLTGMRRGRFGTEQHTATHASGEIFVLFDFTTPSTLRLRLGIYDRQQERFYKAVTIGMAQASVSGRPFTNQARSLMPYAPVNVTGVLSGGNWTINFSRRTRIGGELFDYNDLALNEATEEYEIDIREAPTSEVLRTLTIGPGLPANSAGNLSVDAATQKFIRAANSWISDGFLVGQRVESSGFSNAGNNGRWTISALTATDMTVTDGATTLVTEGAASGRTMNAVTPAVQYTGAQQTADGGSKSLFYAEVYQISDTLRAQDGIGRGFTVQVLID